MRLLVQPLKSEAFEVDTELSDDIPTLKRKIAATRSDLPAERLRIIHGGKLVEDDSCLVGMLGIVPGDFVVVMVAKSSGLKSTDGKASDKAPAAEPSQAPASASVTGVPAAAAAVASTPGAVASASSEDTGRPLDPEHSGDVRGRLLVDEVFEQMQAAPNLARLAQMVSDRPALIDPIVQALRESHPDLAEAINSNRERFLELLAEHRGNLEMDLSDILLTPEDEEAADRLVSLGFTAEAAVKAYIRCRRDEALAASALFQDLKFEPGRAQLAQAASKWWLQQQADERELASPRTYLEELAEDPLFSQLAKTLSQSPELLVPMVAALGHAHPEIAQVIVESPGQFMQFVNSMANDSADAAQQRNLPAASDMDHSQLSDEEEAVITRLIASGSDRGRAVQAFMSSGRNEELAAGLLFQGTLPEVD